ncbi:MAG: GNAT family N-acetyltransferase [Xanthomonadales bacterium]|nr:GNAT family N-acetyltransferase [Xanthomonadales bacterium]
MAQTEAFRLERADASRLDALLPLVRGYHEFEHVHMSDADRAAAIAPLLEPDSPLGCIWLIHSAGGAAGAAVGYVALCFGYSIEFRGRDSFVDEFFLVESARGRGLGSRVLDRVKTEARALGIAALHLEVARDNARARKLYEKWGFGAREQFTLMSCSLL